MAPNLKNSIGLSYFGDDDSYTTPMKPPPRKYQIVWYWVLYFSCLHIAAVYGLYLGVTTAMWYTVAFTAQMQLVSSLGITAGAHRLWTHKTYKAKLPLETALMLFQSASSTDTLISWVRNHILHHKFCVINTQYEGVLRYLKEVSDERQYVGGSGGSESERVIDVVQSDHDTTSKLAIRPIDSQAWSMQYLSNY